MKVIYEFNLKSSETFSIHIYYVLNNLVSIFILFIYLWFRILFLWLK